MNDNLQKKILSSKDDKYSTTDFYTTAMLISQDFIVTEVTKEGPSNKVKRFHFSENSKIRSVVMNYVNGNLQGNIKDFKNAIETVKDMVYSSN